MTTTATVTVDQKTRYVPYREGVERKITRPPKIAHDYNVVLRETKKLQKRAARRYRKAASRSKPMSDQLKKILAQNRDIYEDVKKRRTTTLLQTKVPTPDKGVVVYGLVPWVTNEKKKGLTYSKVYVYAAGANGTLNMRKVNSKKNSIMSYNPYNSINIAGLTLVHVSRIFSAMWEHTNNLLTDFPDRSAQYNFILSCRAEISRIHDSVMNRLVGNVRRLANKQLWASRGLINQEGYKKALDALATVRTRTVLNNMSRAATRRNFKRKIQTLKRQKKNTTFFGTQHKKLTSMRSARYVLNNSQVVNQYLARYRKLMSDKGYGTFANNISAIRATAGNSLSAPITLDTYMDTTSDST